MIVHYYKNYNEKILFYYTFYNENLLSNYTFYDKKMQIFFLNLKKPQKRHDLCHAFSIILFLIHTAASGSSSSPGAAPARRLQSAPLSP